MPRIEITRKDLSVLQLRAEAARTVDAKQTRRLLSIAMGLDGHSRRLAAQAGGIDRQTLRDWLHHSLTAGGGAGATIDSGQAEQPHGPMKQAA